MKNASFVALGGGSEIGASCYWYKFPWPGSKYGYLSIIVDGGMRPRDLTGPDFSGIDHVDYIFISHQHADHCVYVPVLANMFREAIVFVTQEAFEMCALQWKESARKQNLETGEKPLYTGTDVARMIKEQIRIISFWNRIELLASMYVCPPNAGHMLGAASFHLVQDLGFVKKYSIYHSGDISFENQCLIPGAPKVYHSRDEIQTVVGDATNLTVPNVNRNEEVKKFIAAVNEVLVRGGRVVIPVFKYHRAQEIWQILLSNGIPQSLVFVDGNASEIFEIYRQHTSIRALPRSQIIRHGFYDRWQRWTKGSPCVILAFGGMVSEESPAWHNVRLVIENENDALFTVGYMDPCSPGGEILDHFAEGKKEIYIDLERYEIKCRVERFGLGSHAGMEDLHNLAERARDRVIWVHGDDKRVRRFLKEDAPGHHLQGVNGKEILL